MTIDLHNITDYIAYWVLFWTAVNIALPPREVFEGGTPQWYNTLLKLVAYYGAMNLRQVSVKFYDAVNKAPDQLQQSLERASVSAKEQVAVAKETAAAVEQAKDIDAADAAKP